MKRPLSLTIIAWVLIAISLLGVVGIVLMATNPDLFKAQQMDVASPMQQAWTAVGVSVNLVVAYGIFKGQPWSRVLYLVWGAIGAAVSFYTSPKPLTAMIGLIIFIVICAFLFGNRANEWFAARGFALKREDS